MCSPENVQNPKFDMIQEVYGLYNLEIWQMTLKLWEPQVGIYINVVKYDGNQWWNVLTKAGTDGRTEIIYMD